MTTKEQLDPMIDPLVRAYIEIAIAEAMLPLTTQLEAFITERRQGLAALQDAAATLAAQMANLEQRYVEDDKYALTKPKLIRLMNKLGID
jgi:hypothetical protein